MERSGLGPSVMVMDGGRKRRGRRGEWKLCHLCSSQAITECLAEPEVAQSQHVPLLRELLGCVRACVMAAGASCSEHSLRLFSVLLMVSSSKLIGQLQTEVC